MAVYKVPQDVEADDKLIGPFSFRQFVYLLIAAGLIALAVGLFQIFPVLAILPVPPVLLFLALALPLKKDQPMETYLAALVSYYLKPRTRKWTPGQRNSTILITAPKIVEDTRTRDISEEEATHRLSFLADIVDSQGYAIKGISNNNMRDDLVAEANAAEDMFDSYRAGVVSRAIMQDQMEHRDEIIKNMQAAIKRNEENRWNAATVIKDSDTTKAGSQRVIQPLSAPAAQPEPVAKSESVTKPKSPSASESEKPSLASETVAAAEPAAASEPDSAKPVELEEPVPIIQSSEDMKNLANNPDYTVATIAKEANRIKRKDEGEVFISLH